MHITIELTDGRYIVAEPNGKTRLFKAPADGNLNFKEMESHLKQGNTCINIDNVVLIRPAEPEEIRRYEIHGH